MNRHPGHTRIDSRLVEGLDRIASATAVRAAGSFDPDLTPLTPLLTQAPRRGRRAAVAASITAVCGAAVGGGLLMNGAPVAAPPPVPVTVAPAPPPTTVPPLARDGLMTFAQVPDQLATATVELTDASDRYPEDYEPQITRWYTATMDMPEDSPNVRVTSHPGAPNPPYRLDSSETVGVQGLEAFLFDAPFVGGRRSVSLQIGEVTYEISGAHVTDDELLLAAEHLRPADDGFGGVIDPEGLTNGLTERGAGENEMTFVERPVIAAPVRSVIWSRLDETFTDDLNFSLAVTTEPQETLALKRLWEPRPADITDATVHGQPAIVFRNTEADRFAGMSGGTSPNPDDNPTYPEHMPGGARGDLITVVWWENGYTYRAAGVGVGVDRDTVIAWANELRPATQAEADAMAAATKDLYDSADTTIVATSIAGHVDAAGDDPDASGGDEHVGTAPPGPATTDPSDTTTLVVSPP